MSTTKRQPKTWQEEKAQIDARIAASQANKDLITKASMWEGVMRVAGLIGVAIVGLIVTSIYNRVGDVFERVDKQGIEQEYASRERRELKDAIGKIELKLDALAPLISKVAALETQQQALSAAFEMVRQEQMKTREQIIEIRTALKTPGNERAK